MRGFKIAASFISASPQSARDLVKSLNKNRVDYIHFDVMDGDFVPRFGLYPELLAEIKKYTKIPVDVHLMINKPENYIDLFVKAGGDILVPHVESTNHIHRVIRLIKNAGKKAGVALNPGTPLSTLDYLLDEIDFITLMAINPGIVGHKFIPSSYKKISDLSSMLSHFPNVEMEVDGGVSFETASKIINAGANVIVCGAQSIFRNNNLSKNLKDLKLSIK